MNRSAHHIILLKRIGLLGMLFAILYLFWGGALGVPYILNLRLKKILIFLLASVASSWATISFQAIVRSHFLTPGILGIDPYFRFLQTLLIFFGTNLGLRELPAAVQFLGVCGIMVASFGLLSRVSWNRISFDLHTVLMIGLVIGTLFNSAATFLQVLLDPNEYDQLQTRLFASFQNVDDTLLLLAFLLLLPILYRLWKRRHILEVLSLGRETAVSLGVDPDKEVRSIFLMVVVLSAIPAALTGSMLFLGFATVNLTYPLYKTYRMDVLLLGSASIGFLLLLSGQFLVEQVFELQTNVSILVEWAGGVFFFVLLWKGRTGE